MEYVARGFECLGSWWRPVVFYPAVSDNVLVLVLLTSDPIPARPFASLRSSGWLRKVPFDIFDRKYKDSWYTVMQRFRQQVEEIEDMTKSFIEQSFQKLRSAEGAFELVQNFQNIQSRESINQSIDERYKDILSQYTKELDHIGAIFHAHKAAPPIYKNYPPVAGSIAWARDPYNRAKTPILRFKVSSGITFKQILHVPLVVKLPLRRPCSVVYMCCFCYKREPRNMLSFD